MRTKHTSHAVPAFPVYSSAFVSPNELVLGGGGGQSKTGIKNKLRLYRVESDATLDLLHELELDKGEDAPMSMDAYPGRKQFVCGVNSAEEQLQSGSNQNCRVFEVKEGKMSLVRTQSTLTVHDAEDDFQKVTALSSDGKLLAVAGARDLSLLEYPSLKPIASPMHLDKGEIFDATFSSTTLVVATTVNLLVYALPASGADGLGNTNEKKAGKRRETMLQELKLVKSIDRPTLSSDEGGSSFRAVRYHPEDSESLYAVVNTVPPRTTKKSSPRRAFVCKYDIQTWELSKHRKVSDRGLTCFDVSPNGKLLAFASSDYTVGILDAKTLAPLLTVLKAHDFPATTLRFNPSSSLLVSGSADNTVRIVTVPDSLGGNGEPWSFWLIVIVTILIIVFAIIAQQMAQGSF